jgi:flagellin-like protein
MRHDMSHQWRMRSRGRRGVSPIIATILLVAITVVLAAVLYILISGLTRGPGNTPLGSAFGLGSVSEAQAGSNYYYNVSIASASSGLTWNSLNFQVKNAGGGVVSLGTPTYKVLDITGAVVVSSTNGGQSWTAGSGTGASQVATTETISLQTTTSLAGAGDSLVALGVGSYSGSVSQGIP